MRRRLDDGIELDDDPERLDVDAVHAFISKESYWGRGRTRERVLATIAGSARVVGLYEQQTLIGFARAITDGATMAYLADVYVLAPYRGRGLGRELVREMLDGDGAPEVHWLLHTADAEAFYEQLGFARGPLRYPLLERPRRAEAAPAAGASSTPVSPAAGPRQ